MGEPVFFREWDRRGPGARRSLARARELAGRLGVLDGLPPVLAVVGSKGKGTAATCASAVLAAAGLRVVTVTSPAYRSDHERIRVDGRAVGADELRRLAERIEDGIGGLTNSGLTTGGPGYLSPSGLFLIAGVSHGLDAGADALVLEAGMGGASDEVSLFPADVVAVTPVFGEHLGVLGSSVAEIAREKAGVVAATTRAVVSAPQVPEVAAVLDARPPRVPDGAWPLPGGLSRAAAEVGAAAGAELLAVRGQGPPPPSRLREVLATVSLPGRLSLHPVPGAAAAEVLADAAIDRTGIAAALKAAVDRWGAVDHVLVCLPDHKDLDGAFAQLEGLPVTQVRLPYGHLGFTRPLPGGWSVLDAADLTREHLAALGPRVLVLGTVYFVGLVLDLVDAPTERSFTP